MTQTVDRAALTDAAVQAIDAWHAACDTKDRDQATLDAIVRAERRAAVAVNAAIEADIPHTEISSRLAMPAIAVKNGLRPPLGLVVIDLIVDDEARADALRVEREDAERHQRAVLAAMADYARAHVETMGKTRVAEMLDVSRPTIDSWTRRHADA